VKQLQASLSEAKQFRVNVATVEKTLAANVALLRQSAGLAKTWRELSPEAGEIAKMQLHRAEALVKAAEGMVLNSRAQAVEGARVALQQAGDVQSAADALAAEAEKQLQGAKGAAAK
jgi:hypothetical protein